MTRIAVAPNKYARGVSLLGDEWHNSDNPRRVRAVYAVVDLELALRRVYKTDAHMVAYCVRGLDGKPLERQPRVNKCGLSILQARGYSLWCECLVADADNEGHAGWTPAGIEGLQRLKAQIDPHNTMGVFMTSHGARWLQPLARAIPIHEVEPRLRLWLTELERAGVGVDWDCVDWTRHFRMPNVVRDHQLYLCPLMML